MINVDGKITSEIVVEKTEEELASVLRGYKAKPFAWWRIVLSVLVLVAIGVMVMAFEKEAERVKKCFVAFDIIDLFDDPYSDHEEARKAKKENRWKSDTQNKGYLMDYVVSSFYDEGKPMERMLADAERVDPENSFYYYLAASVHTSNYNRCVENVRDEDSESLERNNQKAQEWKVLNQEHFDMALDHIAKAGKRKGIMDRTIDLRLDNLEEPRNLKEGRKMDLLEQTCAMVNIFSDSDHYSISLVSLIDIFRAKFYQLSINGTAEEVKFWMNEHYKLVDALLSGHCFLIDCLVAKACLQNILPNMRAAAERAGLENEVKKITVILDQITVEKKKRLAVNDQEEKSDSKLYSDDSFLTNFMNSSLLRQITDKENFNFPSTKVDRLADHAFVGRLFTMLIVPTLVIISIGMWIFFFAKSKEMRTMSMQSLSALKLLDSIIVIVGGVLLPVIFYVVINQYTELGVRKWSVYELSYAMVVLQFGGMLVTILTLSTALMHWRLHVRLPELISNVRMLGWVLPLLSLSAMILIGMTDSREETLPWNLAGGFLSLAFLGWMVMALVAGFRKKDVLAKVAMCRGMLSVYAVMIIVFAGLYHYYHTQEKYWVSQSEEITFKPEHLGYSLMEYRVAEQMRKEVRERLDMLR